MPSSAAIDPATRIGHVHPRVAGLDRAWPRAPGGRFAMVTRRLDLAALVAEAAA